MESQALAQSLKPLKESAQWLPVRVPKILAMVRIVQNLYIVFGVYMYELKRKNTI